MNEYDYIVNAFTRTGDNTNLEVDNLNVGCVTSKNNNFELDSAGNLTVKSLNTQALSISAREVLFDMLYPIGSIYMSINAINPSTLFGGTWERIKDKFLLASGDTYENGTEGGNSNHSHDFKIGFICSWGMTGGDNFGNAGAYSYQNNTYSKQNGIENDVKNINMNGSFSNSLRSVSDKIRYSVGDTQTASNLPPYLAIYMWKRVS